MQAPDVAFRADGRERKLFRVSGAASIKDRQLTLTLVHTHHREPAEIVLRLRDGKAEGVRLTVLTHAELNAHNTFAHPDVVKPKETEGKERGESIKVVLPPASVTRLDVRLG